MPDGYRKIFGIIFFSFSFFYGVYIAVAAMRNKKRFINSFKRVDLIKVFGDSGRVLYVLLGLALCTLSALMILRLLGIGPFVGVK